MHEGCPEIHTLGSLCEENVLLDDIYFLTLKNGKMFPVSIEAPVSSASPRVRHLFCVVTRGTAKAQTGSGPDGRDLRPFELHQYKLSLSHGGIPLSASGAGQGAGRSSPFTWEDSCSNAAQTLLLLDCC